MEWEASRVLREWGLSEGASHIAGSSAVPDEYARVDRPASANASALALSSGE